MKKITLIDKVAEGIKYPLPQKEVVSIGRNSSNDVVIPDRNYRTSLDREAKKKFDLIVRTISREHCEICQEDGEKLYIVDIGSKNGTYVEEKKLLSDKSAVLSNGNTIKLGDYKLEVKIEE